MKKNKLNLKELKVKSFVTLDEKKKSKTIIGGVPVKNTNNNTMCFVCPTPDATKQTVCQICATNYVC